MNLKMNWRKNNDKKKFNIFTKKIALVTFHPVTKNNINYKDQIKTFLLALSKVNEFYYVFTYNNSDTLGKIFFNLFSWNTDNGVHA